MQSICKVPADVCGTIMLLYSDICFYHEREFVIEKTKAQLPGCPLPAGLPIILRESILFIRFLTYYILFLTNVLCLQAVLLRFSSQRQDSIVLS